MKEEERVKEEEERDRVTELLKKNKDKIDEIQKREMEKVESQYQ